MYLYVEDYEKAFMGGRVGDVKECKEFWKVKRDFLYFYFYYYYLHVGDRKGKSGDEFGSCGD